MKITSPGQARADATDRNPSDASQFAVVAATGPHGNTTRVTYTAPANRSAIVELIYLRIHRVTAAAPVGAVSMNVNINGGTRVFSSTYDNSIDGLKEVAYPGRFSVRIANQVTVATADVGTGGTVDYDARLKILEYDT